MTLTITSVGSTIAGLNVSISLTSFLPNHANAFIFSPLGSAQAGFLLGFETSGVVSNLFVASPISRPAAFAAAFAMSE